MTIDNYLAVATALMTVANTIWLSTLVIEIRRHNNAVRLHNQRVPTPIQSTPAKSRSTINQPAPPIVCPPINPSEVW